MHDPDATGVPEDPFDQLVEERVTKGTGRVSVSVKERSGVAHWVPQYPVVKGVTPHPIKRTARGGHLTLGELPPIIELVI